MLKVSYPLTHIRPIYTNKDTSQSISIVNQWTGFYTNVTLGWYGLIS